MLGWCNMPKTQEKHEVLETCEVPDYEQSAPCLSCFEQGLPTSHCCITLGHSGPGVYWMTVGLEEQEKVPQCYRSLHSISFTIGIKHLLSTKKTQNAPGSRLSGCQAMLNARLLKTECGEMLPITFPLPTAHSGHLLKSLADMLSFV